MYFLSSDYKDRVALKLRILAKILLLQNLERKEINVASFCSFNMTLLLHFHHLANDVFRAVRRITPSKPTLVKVNHKPSYTEWVDQMCQTLASGPNLGPRGNTKSLLKLARRHTAHCSFNTTNPRMLRGYFGASIGTGPLLKKFKFF